VKEEKGEKRNLEGEYMQLRHTLIEFGPEKMRMTMALTRSRSWTIVWSIGVARPRTFETETI